MPSSSNGNDKESEAPNKEQRIETTVDMQIADDEAGLVIIDINLNQLQINQYLVNQINDQNSHALDAWNILPWRESPLLANLGVFHILYLAEYPTVNRTKEPHRPIVKCRTSRYPSTVIVGDTV